MKKIKYFAALVFLVLFCMQSESLAQGQNGQPNLTPVYRENGAYDYLYTLNYGEGYPTYTYGGSYFFVLHDPSGANGSPLKGLFRCNTGREHFVSNDGNCEGTYSEGQFGWVYSYAQIGTVPLYRYYSASRGNHLITTNYSEATPDYVYETTLGFVVPGYTPPPPPPPPVLNVTCSVVGSDGRTYTATGPSVDSATQSVLQECTLNPRNVCSASHVVCHQ